MYVDKVPGVDIDKIDKIDPEKIFKLEKAKQQVNVSVTNKFGDISGGDAAGIKRGIAGALGTPFQVELKKIIQSTL